MENTCSIIVFISGNIKYIWHFFNTKTMRLTGEKGKKIMNIFHGEMFLFCSFWKSVHEKFQSRV